jgi:hypothetical protein
MEVHPTGREPLWKERSIFPHNAQPQSGRHAEGQGVRRAAVHAEGDTTELGSSCRGSEVHARGTAPRVTVPASAAVEEMHAVGGVGHADVEPTTLRPTL